MPRKQAEESPFEVLSAGDALFGARLAELRKAAGLRQVELADRIGLVQAQISHIEVGKRTTTIHRLLRWLEACGATWTIDHANSKDPRAELMAAAEGLGPDEVRQLARAARALAKLDRGRRDEEVGVLEMRAGIK